MRIAMWSGPRNLSTALMYSFAARGDFAVWDEPFYAPYLQSTGLDHPMAAEIVETHDPDAARVAAACAGEIPGGKANFYLKLMTHHMLPDVPMGWAADFVHVHLIRHPARVIASYAAKRENPTLEDLGYAQQNRLFERLGGVVVDSYDIRVDPRSTLTRLCDAVGLTFDEGMLSWPAGPIPQDGVWARHWYNAVHKSTGFAGAEWPLPELPAEFDQLLGQAEPHYAALQKLKI